MERLFVYGTLKEPAISKSVFGRDVHGFADVLEGYVISHIEIEGETYPIISKKADSSVEGLVISVIVEELALIDA